MKKMTLIHDRNEKILHSTHQHERYSCIVLDDYMSCAFSYADWSSLDDQISYRSIPTHISDVSQLISQLQSCNILVIMRERTKITREIISQLPELKLIITTGMRNQAIDLPAAKEHHIAVCGTDLDKQPTVELTWALILALARDIPQQRLDHSPDRQWINHIGVDLQDKTLGIIGLGTIGSAVAHIASSFHMNTIAWSQNLTAEHAQAHACHKATSLYDLLERSDFISIHTVLSERTRHLLDADALSYVKKSACIINTSRSQIIDIAALKDSLRQQCLRGAALDVFDIEPLPLADDIRNFPQIIATPHLGYVTENNYRTFFSQIVENIQGFLQDNLIREIIATEEPLCT